MAQVSMVYTMAQLDYPVQNMLDKAWGLWVGDVGADTKLSQILSFTDCAMIIGTANRNVNAILSRNIRLTMQK